jgi:hypothetical protein
MTITTRTNSTTRRRSTRSRTVIFGMAFARGERKLAIAITIPAAITMTMGRIQRSQTTAELNAIDKKFCPSGEVGGWFCSTIDPDNIARDKERENETENGKECEPAPRDCIPVHHAPVTRVFGSKVNWMGREWEGEEDEDRPPHPFSYECFLCIVE